MSFIMGTKWVVLALKSYQCGHSLPVHLATSQKSPRQKVEGITSRYNIISQNKGKLLYLPEAGVVSWNGGGVPVPVPTHLRLNQTTEMALII